MNCKVQTISIKPIDLSPRHSRRGHISMVGAGDNLFGSQFILTLDDDLGHLDGDNRVFGEVTDGLEVLDKFNEVIVDETHRPFQVRNS